MLERPECAALVVGYFGGLALTAYVLNTYFPWLIGG